MLMEAAKRILGISPDLARAISITYADLAPTQPVKALFTTLHNGVKQLPSAANKMALVGPESSEGFGTLSLVTADAPLLAAAIKSHFGTEGLPDMAAALLSRFERSVGAAVTEQKKGRGRPHSNFEEAVVLKVTLATAPKPAPTKVSVIPFQPVRSPLPQDWTWASLYQK